MNNIAARYLGLLLSLLAAGLSYATTFTVTDTSDASSGGSLRAAIISANAVSGPHTITFNIPAATDPNCVAATGVCTISLLSALPFITQIVTIDGYTQPGATPNTNPPNLGTNAALRVEVTSPTTASTLTLSGNGSKIRGLILNRGFGIALQGSGGHTVEGNFIGTNAAGNAGFAIGQNGISVGSNSNNNQIGGTTPAARNVISGNSSGTGILISSASVPIVGTQIQGNLIGTNAAGTAAIANDAAIAFLQAGGRNTVIGGATASARNVISGNTTGIFDESFIIGTASNNAIKGNYIGVDVTSAAALGNGSYGVNLSSRGGLLGGSASGESNIIAANGPTANVIIVGRDIVVQGNLIGTGVSGLSAPTGFVPSAFRVPGVFVTGGVAAIGSAIGGTATGAGNVIAFNTGHGVLLNNDVGNGHSILSNSIFSNAQLGIKVSSPGGEKSPVLTSATAAGNVQGTLNSIASNTFRLEFFASPACNASGFGEGKTFIGFQSVTTDGSGNASFNATFAALPADQLVITATATDANGNTSEFSQCLTLAAATTVTLFVNHAGSGSGTVTSIPAGIDCAAACSAIYATGTQVSLTATPQAGSRFTGWSGVDCAGLGACVVTLDATTSVTANFDINIVDVSQSLPAPTLSTPAVLGLLLLVLAVGAIALRRESGARPN